MWCSDGAGIAPLSTTPILVHACSARHWRRPMAPRSGAAEHRRTFLGERLDRLARVLRTEAHRLTARFVLQRLLDRGLEAVTQQALRHRERERRPGREARGPLVDECVEIAIGQHP